MNAPSHPAPASARGAAGAALPPLSPIPQLPKTERRQPVLAMLVILLAGIGGLLAIFWLLVQPTEQAPLPKLNRRQQYDALPAAPGAAPPAVEPLEFSDIAADVARARNASIPFSTEPNPAARPFVFTGRPLDEARAVDCLAAAVYYEAGDDALGQASVAQVVLNRVRHPAFPKTVCGVVFQGSERQTGCQFTFTCDGAMDRRRPSAAAWKRAQLAAMAALGGNVFPAVGLATHYHTNWVFPQWNAKMEKITAVRAHLFFRWHGTWGKPGTFAGGGTGVPEPVIAKLMPLSPVHDLSKADADLITTSTVDMPDEGRATLSIEPASAPLPDGAAAALKYSVMRRYDRQTGTFYIALDRDVSGGSYALMALNLCAKVTPCRVFGWTDPSSVSTAAVPDDAALSRMSFFYGRGGSYGGGTALWNCRQFQRPSDRQCLPESFKDWGGLRAAPAAAAQTSVQEKPLTAFVQVAKPITAEGTP